MPPHLTLPTGTCVTLRAALAADAAGARLPPGAVGRVTAAPQAPGGTYEVAFPGGERRRLTRDQLEIYRRRQEASLAGLAGDYDLRADHVILRCVVGSRAYGLARGDSDTDRRGVYLAPAKLHWSLAGAPEQLEDKAAEECFWELGKFLKLALKANPNILECLFTPLVEAATPRGRALLELREAFLSRRCYETFQGYALSQFRKLEQDLRARGEIRWKHAMHLVRLLLAGVGLLETGTLAVDVGGDRERLLAIKDGAVPWEEVDAWRRELHARFDAAAEATALPPEPDYARVQEFLWDARLEAVGR